MTRRSVDKSICKQGPALDRLAAWAQSQKAAGEKPAAQYRAFLKQLHKQVPYQAATLKGRKASGDRFTTLVEIDGGAEIVDFIDIGLGSGMSGYSADQGRPILLNRHSVRRLAEPLPFECFASLPLQWLGEVWGVLNLGMAVAGTITDENLAQLQATTLPLAALLAQNDLRGRHQQLMDDLEQTRSSLGRARRGLEALEQVAEAAETAASVVHQINNPLAVIIGNIQCLIAERAAPNQKALSRLKRAESAALEIAEVNRRLLHIHAMHQKETTVPGQSPAPGRS